MWQARHRSEHSEPTTHLHRDNGSFSFIWAGTQPWATVPKKLSWKQRTGTGRFIQQSWGGQVPWTTLRHTGHRFKGCQRHKQCRSLSATFVGSERRSFCRYNHIRSILALYGDFTETKWWYCLLHSVEFYVKLPSYLGHIPSTTVVFGNQYPPFQNQWK